MFSDVYKESRLAKLGWEYTIARDSRIGFEVIETTLFVASMVHDDQFTFVIERDRRDLKRRVCNLALPLNRLPIMLDSPYLSCRVIAIDIGTYQFRQSFSVVNDTTCQ